MTNSNPFNNIIAKIDFTEMFRDKGDLRRWSIKRSVGGVVVAEAMYQIHEFGITWQGVALTLVGVLPLIVSFFESRKE